MEAHVINSRIVHSSSRHLRHLEEFELAQMQQSRVQGPPVAAESLEERSHRLRNEWTETEFLRPSKAYQARADVDAISGSLGPLYYANVTVAGTSVEAMVDPGSSATIMSFELFRNIGAKAKIPVEALKRPDVASWDYSQRPIPIGACVDLELEWQGKSVTTTVYLRYDLGAQDEPYLLGTNVVIPLGLMVPGVGVEPCGGDLSLKGVANPVVQLVQARRVPGCSATFLKARVDTGVLPSGAVVFEPSRDWLKDTGLYMEESVLRTDPEGYVYVMVQNPTAIPRQIGAGAIVGKAEELGHVVEPEELVGEPEAEVECMDGVGLPEGMAEVVEKATGDSEQPVCRVESGRVESGVDARKEMLEKLIKVSGEGLTTDEKQRLCC